MPDLIHETELRLKDSITGKMPRIKNSLLDTHRAMMQFGNQKIGSGPVFDAIAGPGMGVIKGAAGAFVALGGALATVSAISMKNASEFEALVLALTAVEGSATKAKSAMDDLKNIAKLPGLGFEESVGAYLKLRNSGMDSGFAKQLIESFGKANARAGGGKDEFGRIMLAVSQMALKPNLSGEELMQLNEANIPASKLIKDKFGTIDAEQLKKKGVNSQMVLHALADEFGKLTATASGAKNAFDNLEDALKFVSVAFGQGLNDSLISDIGGLSDVLSKLESSGALNELGQALGNMASMTIGDLTGSDSLEDSMRELTVATFELAGYMRNVGENSKGIVDFIKDDFKKSPIANWITNKLGLDGSGEAGVTGGPSAADAFRGTLEQREFIEKQKRKRAAALGENTPDKDKEQDVDVQKLDNLKRQTAKLDQIAENTRPLREIVDRIVGGGGFARARLSAVNIAHAGSRGARMIQQGHNIINSNRLASMNRNGDFYPTGF